MAKKRAQKTIVMGKGRGKGARCHWCKRALEASTAPSTIAATRDHIEPKWGGGHKCVWACRACNQIKGGMTLPQWHEFMEKNPEWWRRFKSPARRRQLVASGGFWAPTLRLMEEPRP